MAKNINGPINVVRLEGTVNGINKVIYMFMDVHVSPENQTECPDIRSKDIKNFFIENFDKIGKEGKVYDFLVEYFPTDIVSRKDSAAHSLYKGKYLVQIRKLFLAGVFIKNDKIRISKKFPNMRFHYLDIRDYTKLYIAAMDKLYNFIMGIWDHGPRAADISIIKDTANIITSHGKFLYDTFYNSNSHKSKLAKPIVPATADALSNYTDRDTNAAARHLITKIKNDYHHDNIKKKIRSIINNELKISFNNFFDAANKLDTYLVNNSEKISYPSNKLYDMGDLGANYGYPERHKRYTANMLWQLWNMYNKFWGHFQLNIMDTYFLRRFLDKEYITNAITYTGSAHSVNYVYILVKYFGFKITHSSYMKYDTKKSTEIIKKAKNSDSIEVLFYPIKLIQCSNLSNFPSMFK